MLGALMGLTRGTNITVPRRSLLTLITLVSPTLTLPQQLVDICTELTRENMETDQTSQVMPVFKRERRNPKRGLYLYSLLIGPLVIYRRHVHHDLDLLSPISYFLSFFFFLRYNCLLFSFRHAFQLRCI